MSRKHCPHCNCTTDVIKIGTTSAGRQRYKCKLCRKTWTNTRKANRLYANIWDDFALNDLTVPQLINNHKLSDKTVRKILSNYNIEPLVPAGPVTTIAMDATYFGREWGLIIVIDVHTGKCLYVSPIQGYETVCDYRLAIRYLLQYNIHPKACVVDGKKGVIPMLEEYDIIPQYCQFHQIKTINSYLTRNPILKPNIDLRNLVLSLTHVKAEIFARELRGWLSQYRIWLNERARNPETGKLEYSHQKTRSAINSLRANLWYLFNFEFYSKYDIPNTNNMLEGINRALKYKLRRHSGATKELKIKIARTFLSRRTEM